MASVVRPLWRAELPCGGGPSPAHKDHVPHSHVHRPVQTWGIPHKAAQEFASLQTFCYWSTRTLLSEEHNLACTGKLPVTPSGNQNLMLLFMYKPENMKTWLQFLEIKLDHLKPAKMALCSLKLFSFQ